MQLKITVWKIVDTEMTFKIMNIKLVKSYCADKIEKRPFKVRVHI